MQVNPISILPYTVAKAVAASIADCCGMWLPVQQQLDAWSEADSFFPSFCLKRA
jgi:hypothetical protein